jgi:hypothetical protein
VKIHPQFSIVSLLLTTTIVALSVTVGMLYRELVPMRQELARLRQETGRLDIGDPTRLHAIRVNTDNDLEWRWRIWVPEGLSYRVRVVGGPISGQEYPVDGGSFHLHKPGEHVIRYCISRNPKDGHWCGKLYSASGKVGEYNQSWVEWSRQTSTSVGVPSSTVSYDATAKRIDLIRHRVSQTATSSNAIEDPAAGFLIWLERQ